jgi:hypothetical protein
LNLSIAYHSLIETLQILNVSSKTVLEHTQDA